jgi:hypothetical protein
MIVFGAERFMMSAGSLGTGRSGRLGPQHVIALKDPGGQVEHTEHL